MASPSWAVVRPLMSEYVKPTLPFCGSSPSSACSLRFIRVRPQLLVVAALSFSNSGIPELSIKLDARIMSLFSGF